MTQSNSKKRTEQKGQTFSETFEKDGMKIVVTKRFELNKVGITQRTYDSHENLIKEKIKFRYKSFPTK